MIKEFIPVTEGISALIEPSLAKWKALEEEVFYSRRNSQHRTIKQIIGHMIDSASNNTHRFIHMQYRQSPVEYPNYATQGNNDRWIAIQNYQDEEWNMLLNIWKYANLHIIHVIKNIDPEKLEATWIAGPDAAVSLKEMVVDFLPHFKLHLAEIDELIHRDPEPMHR